MVPHGTTQVTMASPCVTAFPESEFLQVWLQLVMGSGGQGHSCTEEDASLAVEPHLELHGQWGMCQATPNTAGKIRTSIKPNQMLKKHAKLHSSSKGSASKEGVSRILADWLVTVDGW